MSTILHVNYVSKLYSGSISDKEIVNVSGSLEKLNPAMLYWLIRVFTFKIF